MKYCLIILFLLFNVLGASAQNLKIEGKITNAQGEVVPFASIYVKNTTQGTSANREGVYQLNLPKGSHELVFKSVGYRQQNKQINLQANQILNVRFEKEIFELKDVVVQAGGEDPAYAIIRNAINKRKHYLLELDAYTCEVYIKSLQKMLDAPEKFMFQDVSKLFEEYGLDSNRRGITYLSESESRFSYIKPDKFREEVISSRVAGSSSKLTFNQALSMRLNLYNNLQRFNSNLVSERPIISPIADNALAYYNYKFLGSSFENGELVNKIQLLPKRSNDPVYRGYLYIMDESWRIHSADIWLTKEANMNLLDSLKITQQYIPVDNQVWMPASTKYDFSWSKLNFKFGGYYLASFKNYDLNPKLDKKQFNEVLRITSDVSKRDTAYWAQSRAVQLTEEEQQGFVKKEQLRFKFESKKYLDSLEKAKNQFNPLSFVLTDGYTLNRPDTKEKYHFRSLAGAVFYNTVEGFGMNYGVSYTRELDTVHKRKLYLEGNIRYSLERKKFNTNLNGSFPVQRTLIGFSLGSDVVDLNNAAATIAIENSLSSLLDKVNFQKFYEKRFASLSVSRRVGDGLEAGISASWANRKWLPNISSFSYKKKEGPDFTSNNPFSPGIDKSLFAENQAFTVNARLSYEFDKRYINTPSGKEYLPSKYPMLSLSYSKGIRSVLSSDVDFDLLVFEMTQSNLKMGLYGKTSLMFGAGKFLNKQSIFYTDYKHFVQTRTLQKEEAFKGFLLLDNYRNSANHQYLEGHLEHNFSGFLINKVPFARKAKLQEIVGLNYLTSSGLKSYTEFCMGLQFSRLRGMYGLSYSGKQVGQGFKFSVLL